MARLTGGQAVVEGLKREGVEVVFGIAGAHCLPIYDALHGTPEIREITVRHEQTAAYMADGYARVAGRPGVCLTTTGPGALNTLAAMHTALSDCSPVLQIMSQVDARSLGQNTGALHEVKDQPGMFARVTNWNASVKSAEEIMPAIGKAMRVMGTQRPGPTAIEIGLDVLARTEEVELPERRERGRPEGEAREIDRAAAVLAAARQPVIYAGGGAALAGAGPEIQELAELLQAPVFVSAGGKGLLPEDHALSMGAASGTAEGRELAAIADGALVVGVRLTGRVAGRLEVPRPVVQVDIDAAEIGRNHPTEVGIVGDAKVVLAQLLRRLREGNAAPRTSREAEIGGLRRRLEGRALVSGPAEMRVFESLSRALDRTAIIAADMTVIAYWARVFFKSLAPRSFLHPNGFGTLGFAFPAALGAKVAAPDRQVVVMTGDGGFLFAGSELATAVKYGLDVVTVIFNDNAYGMLKIMQNGQYGGRQIGVDLVNPDFVKLAEAFGARGRHLDSPDDLGDAVREGFSLGGPVVIEVPFTAAPPRW